MSKYYYKYFKYKNRYLYLKGGEGNGDLYDSTWGNIDFIKGTLEFCNGELLSYKINADDNIKTLITEYLQLKIKILQTIQKINIKIADYSISTKLKEIPNIIINEITDKIMNEIKNNNIMKEITDNNILINVQYDNAQTCINTYNNIIDKNEEYYKTYGLQIQKNINNMIDSCNNTKNIITTRETIKQFLTIPYSSTFINTLQSQNKLNEKFYNDLNKICDTINTCTVIKNNLEAKKTAYTNALNFNNALKLNKDITTLTNKIKLCEKNIKTTIDLKIDIFKKIFNLGT